MAVRGAAKKQVSSITLDLGATAKEIARSETKHSGSASHIDPIQAREIAISRSKYPESASHIEDSIAGGHPEVLTIDRSGAKIRRRKSLNDTPVVSKKDRDEYLRAMFKEGGSGASVRLSHLRTTVALVLA